MTRLVLCKLKNCRLTWNRKCWSLEKKSNAWKKVSDLPGAVSGAAVATLPINSSSETVFAIGGFFSRSHFESKSNFQTGTTKKEYSDRILHWDPTSDVWTSDEIKLPFPVSGASFRKNFRLNQYSIPLFNYD
jgi:hypothetical protein